ncbi:MAG: EamA family transporter [Ornithinimicrobium sp.]
MASTGMVGPGVPESADQLPEPAVPPVALVLGAVVSVQFGGALAVLLLPLIGLAGSVALRLTLATVVLWALVRPRLLRRSRADWLVVARFALALTVMNLAFYGSLERLPIGVAVTIEFLGPLTLAAFLSRRRVDAAAVAAALIGVVLISEVATSSWDSIDLLGVALAALAGVCWAAYIVTSGQTGARFEGLDGIAIAMAMASAAMIPVLAGSALAGGFSPAEMLDGRVLLLGLAVAVMSSALPYSLELSALRHLAAGVFGVLLSLEPAVAALAGLLLLGQTLSATQLTGMALVVLASITVLGRSGTGPSGMEGAGA